MRFDEPDIREAYRRGAHDCYESLANVMNRRQGREMEAWLKELDTWDYSDPPPPTR